MSLLDKARELLAKGDEDQARALILRYRLVPGQSAEEYLNWGELCEDLALPRQALECYQKALAVSPDHPQALWALGRLYYEIGDLAATKRTLKRLLQQNPEHKETRHLLARVYRELGEAGSYAVLTGNQEKSSIQGPRYFPPSLGERDLEALSVFLKGRKAFAELILNPHTGGPVFLYREAPLGAAELRAHLLGERYLAVYPIDEERRTQVAFLSIFIPEKERARHARERSWLYLKQEAVRQQALAVLKTTLAEDLSAALERVSPYRYRLWFFFKEPMHFLWARRFLKALEERLPYPEQGVVYKSWGLTEGVGLGWREQAVPLPLGCNPITTERALFVDQHGEPYPEQLTFLKKMRYLSPREVRAFCRAQELRWEPRTGDVLDELLQRLCEKCPVIQALVHKAQAGRRLRREEKLALFLTVGLLDQEGRLLHEVLHPCPDYRYARVERQRQGLPPNPVSCYKLRYWFPGLTSSVPCHCVFEDTGGRYPSPLLHVAPILVPPEEERLTLRHLSPTELARKYYFYQQEKKKLERRLARMRRELINYLKAHPGRRLSLGKGRFLTLRWQTIVVEEE